MRIGAARIERDGSLARLVIPVTFEEVSNERIEVFFEAPDGSPLATTVEPVVRAAAVAAHALGEAQLTVEEPVDPRLVANVSGALDVLRIWERSEQPPLRWQYSPRVPTPSAPKTAFCMTGGIDSSALLVANHDRYTDDHPLRISAGIVVYGLDRSTAGDPLAPDPFLQDIAASRSVELRAVRTNVRDLLSSTAAWHYQIQAAVLVGAAHAVGPDCTDLLIAPSGDRSLAPYGSHPALDHRFGSTELRVHHEHVGETRYGRITLVSEDPVLRDCVQVCDRPRSEWGEQTLNCGRCEKCIRTMVGFRAAGVANVPSFAGDGVDAAVLDALPAPRGLEPADWAGLIGPLRARGEDELAAAAGRFVRKLWIRQARSAVARRVKRS